MKYILAGFLVFMGCLAMLTGIFVIPETKTVIHQIYSSCNYILGVLWFILAKLVWSTKSESATPIVE